MFIKFFILMLALLQVTNSNAQIFELAEEYEPVLDCPAYAGAPNLMVARDSDKNYYLAALVSKKVKLHALEIIDGDMGYIGLAFKRDYSAGKLSYYVETIYVNNNEEEIDDASKAIITHGRIFSENRIDDQECIAIGKPKALLDQ